MCRFSRFIIFIFFIITFFLLHFLRFIALLLLHYRCVLRFFAVWFSSDFLQVSASLYYYYYYYYWHYYWYYWHFHYHFIMPLRHFTCSHYYSCRYDISISITLIASFHSYISFSPGLIILEISFRFRCKYFSSSIHFFFFFSIVSPFSSSADIRLFRHYFMLLFTPAYCSHYFIIDARTLCTDYFISLFHYDVPHFHYF